MDHWASSMVIKAYISEYSRMCQLRALKLTALYMYVHVCAKRWYACKSICSSPVDRERVRVKRMAFGPSWQRR